MVFHLDSQALIADHITWPLGHRPTLEHSMQSEAKVIVQPGGRMLLDHKRKRPNITGLLRLPGRLSRLAEVAHRAIAFQLLIDQAGGRELLLFGLTSQAAS